MIDVRSPSEFAEDHWPGAINLPVLYDAERAQVGTLYKQQDPFTARKLGAALVTHNISGHLHCHFQDKDRTYHPLIYCWRGGQRSESFGTVLAQIGWGVTIIQGGYKTYRAWVREQLQTRVSLLTLRILRGPTGVGKTLILNRMAELGHQILNLEGLAHHRGSLLGEDWTTPQPSQKLFETKLVQCLQQLDPSQPVWIESESNRVGDLHIPGTMWKQMRVARCVDVEAPLQVRVSHLMKEYPHLIAHPDILKRKLQHLVQHQGRARIQHWIHLIDHQAWDQFVSEILEHHYDVAYRHSLIRTFKASQQIFQLKDHSLNSIDTLIQTMAGCP